MRYQIPPRLAYVIDEADPTSTVVYLMRLPDGEPLILQGSGGAIWSLAAEGEDAIVATLAAAVELSPEEVAADVESFLDYLVRQGLLQAPSS